MATTSAPRREEQTYNDYLLHLQSRFSRLRLWINGTKYQDSRGVWRNGGLKDSEGMADLVGWIDGRWLEVEVKMREGRQKLSQERHEALVRAHGGIYVLARSPEEAERLIRAALEHRP